VASKACGCGAVLKSNTPGYLCLTKTAWAGQSPLRSVCSRTPALRRGSGAAAGRLRAVLNLPAEDSTVMHCRALPSDISPSSQKSPLCSQQSNFTGLVYFICREAYAPGGA